MENILKACCHYSILAPIQIPILLGTTEYLRTYDVNDSKKAIESKFWPTFDLSIKYWPFMNFVVYQWVPCHMR